MNKHNGFTLIELLICIAILGIIAGVVLGSSNNNSNVSWGFNGTTEVRCIAGYKHVVGDGGQARQVIDAEGGGVKCNE